MQAAFWAGLAFLAAGAVATLQGSFGWGFLGLLAGFALVLARFTDHAGYRYGGALVSAALGLVVLMPLHEGRRTDRTDIPPRPPLSTPSSRPSVDALPGGASKAPVPAIVSAGAPPPPRPAVLLTEEHRQVIFQELLRARTRASREAAAAHPDRAPIGTTPNPERMMKRAQKRSNLGRLLEVKYLREVTDRHGLAEEQAGQILREGVEKSWPAPPDTQG